MPEGIPVTPFKQNAWGSLGDALAIPLQAYAAKKFHDLQFQDMLKSYMLKSRVEGTRVNADKASGYPGTEMTDPNSGMNTVVPQDPKAAIMNWLLPLMMGGKPAQGPGGPAPAGGPSGSPMTGPTATPASTPTGGGPSGGGEPGFSLQPEDIFKYATGITPTKMADPAVVKGLWDTAGASKVSMPPMPKGGVSADQLKEYEGIFDRGLKINEFNQRQNLAQDKYDELMTWRKENAADRKSAKSQNAVDKFYQFQSLMPQRMANLEDKAAMSAFGDKYKIGGFDSLPFENRLELENKLSDQMVNEASSLTHWAKDAGQDTMNPLLGRIADIQLHAKRSKDPVVLQNLGVAQGLVKHSVQNGVDPAIVYRKLLELLSAKPGGQP